MFRFAGLEILPWRSKVMTSGCCSIHIMQCACWNFGDCMGAHLQWVCVLLSYAPSIYSCPVHSAAITIWIVHLILNIKRVMDFKLKDLFKKTSVTDKMLLLQSVLSKTSECRPLCMSVTLCILTYIGSWPDTEQLCVWIGWKAACPSHQLQSGSV